MIALFAGYVKFFSLRPDAARGDLWIKGCKTSAESGIAGLTPSAHGKARRFRSAIGKVEELDCMQHWYCGC